MESLQTIECQTLPPVCQMLAETLPGSLPSCARGWDGQGNGTNPLIQMHGLPRISCVSLANHLTFLGLSFLLFKKAIIIVPSCLSFLWQLLHSIINLVALNDRHVFSHGSGGRESKIKVSPGPCSLLRL